MIDEVHEARMSEARRTALRVLQAAEHWVAGAWLARECGLADTRALRKFVICPLRFRDRVPIHYKPGSGGGYKIRVTAGEHAACVAAARRMGRDFFALAGQLKQESLDVVAGQMVMEFFPARDGERAGAAPPADDALGQLIDAQARRGRRVRWVDVVQNLLAVMAERPEEYADEIEEVRKRFGGLFLPAEERRRLSQHLDAARQIVGGAAARG